MLKSRRAFARLEFKGYTLAAQDVWLPKRELRDSQARTKYFNQERNARQPGDLFITRIIDEKMGPDDERLR